MIRAARTARAARVVLALLLLGAAACRHAGPYVSGPRHVRPAPQAEIDQVLLLVGDAGHPDPDGEPTLRALRQEVLRRPDRTTVVYLGDNVYETGMPDETPLEGTVAGEVLDEALQTLWESRLDAERRVDAQLDVVRGTAARAIFVPGNHDWDQFGVGGWERVRALGRYIRRMDRAPDLRAEVLPEGGCPGPRTVAMGRRTALVALDTQWWLDAGLGGKPGPDENPTGCLALTEAQVLRSLGQRLRELAEAGRRTVVVGHHPLASQGEHGGHFAWPMHLFPLRMMEAYLPKPLEWVPLPGVGTLMVAVRACCSPDDQDLAGPGNEHMREAIAGALERAAAADAAPILYAAGHDHSVQLFDRRTGGTYTAVSGMGSSTKTSAVGHDARTLFAHANAEHPGFLRVAVLRDGSARLAVLEWDPAIAGPREVYSRWLARPLAATAGAAAPAPDAGSSTPAPSSSQARKRPPA